LAENNDVQRVKDATDLVALIGERVVLKQRGREFWGCCPFHNEKTPSMKVDPAMQSYYCFGCQEHGDVFTYLEKTENLEFKEALKILAERANIELQDTGERVEKGKRARLIEVCEKTAAFYHHQLMRVRSSGSDAARAYLAKRGFGGETPKEWTLGFAPGRGSLVKFLTQAGFSRDELIEANVAYAKEDNRITDRFYDRIIFPIRDLHGRVIGFGGRDIGPSKPNVAKYLNTSDTALFHKRENLYAIDRAKANITTTATAIVVEGYTDVIVMHRCGFTNTVATLGTSLTAQHVKTLKRYARRVINLFDGDEAGLKAAEKAAALITTELGAAGLESIDFLVAVIPAGADPAEYCENEGVEKMQAVLDSAVPLLRFSIDRRLEGADLKSPEKRTRALKEALQVLLPIRGTLLADDYVNYLAGVFHVDFEAVRTAFAGMKAPRVAFDATSSVTYGAASGSTLGSDTARIPVSDDFELDPLIFAAQDRIIGYERELIIFAVTFPAVRRLLAEVFSRIAFASELHQQVVTSMLSEPAWLDEQPSKLAARIIAAIPQAARLLSAGKALIQEEEALAHARILMFSLREEQLEQEIKMLRAQYRQFEDEGSSEARKLFIEIANKQKELNDVQRRFAGLPKTRD